MRVAKRLSFLLLFGCLLVQSALVSAQQSRPDDEITKLADDVYLFRHRFHQAVFVITPQGVIVADPISPGRRDLAQDGDQKTHGPTCALRNL